MLNYSDRFFDVFLLRIGNGLMFGYCSNLDFDVGYLFFDIIKPSVQVLEEPYQKPKERSQNGLERDDEDLFDVCEKQLFNHNKNTLSVLFTVHKQKIKRR
jgi:hypothetical protein